MISFITEVIDEDDEITEEVRNLLSIAYKNVVGSHRSAWRAIYNLEMKEERKVILEGKL